MQNRIISKKLCNFLIQGAEANLSFARKLTDATGIDFQEKTTEFILDQFKNAYGGLWVGGTAFLTENELTFKPNMMNKIFHTGENSLSIPLAEIINIEDKFGFFTRIIHITTANSTLKLRCYGAKAFAKSIQKTILDAKI